MKLDGRELKKLVESIDRATHDWVIISKCRHGKRLSDGSHAIMDGDKPLIYLPKRGFHSEGCIFGELVTVGSECKLFTNEMSRLGRNGAFGDTVMLKECTPEMQEIADPLWAYREYDMIPVLLADNGDPWPLGDWCVVEMERATGLPTAETHEWTQAGTVLFAGPEADQELVGERVLTMRHAIVLHSHGRLLGLMSENKMLGVLDPDEQIGLTTYK